MIGDIELVIKNRQKILYYFLPLFSLTFALTNSSSAGESYVWKLMPLRSAEMKAAGLQGGEGFQMIFALTYAQSDPSRVYAGTDTGQTYRSDDGGRNWKRAARGYLATGAFDMAVDPVNRDVVFAAGGHDYAISDKAGGVYRTTNGGESWEKVFGAVYKKMPNNTHGSMFWIDSNTVKSGRNQVIYTAVHDGKGIFRSNNGGDTWKNIGFDDLGVVSDLQRNPFSSEFWVCSDKGLYVINDNSGTYSKRLINLKDVGLPDGKNEMIGRIQFHPKDKNIIYALSGKAGFYVSRDGGKSFKAANNGIPVSVVGKRPASMLLMNPLRPEWLIIGWWQVNEGANYMSFDGGQTWRPFRNMDSTRLSRHIPHVTDRYDGSLDTFFVARKAAFHPTRPDIALTGGAASHIERTEDGGKSWQYSSNGLSGGRVSTARTSFSFARSRSHELVFFLTDHGPFRSIDSGSTFRSLFPIRVDGARSSPVGAVHPYDANFIICASGHWGEQQLILSVDGGKSWMIALEDKYNYKFLAINQQNPKIIYAGPYRSDDGGRTWIKLAYPVADMNETDGNQIHALVSDQDTTKVYFSTNRGDNWERIGDDIPVGGVHEIAVSYTNKRVYVPSRKGLYIWDGVQWKLRNAKNGLPPDIYGNDGLRNIVISPLDNRIIFVSRLTARIGHSESVLRSRDEGITWELITGNLGEMGIWAMAADSRHNRLYIGSSSGTWYLENALSVK